MPSQHGQTSVIEHISVKEPKMYDVVLLNDDFTTMDFVVDVLMAVFRHSPDEALAIMLNIHNNGSGVAGTYAYDIAETKAQKVIALARNEDFPLRVKVVPHN